MTSGVQGGINFPSLYLTKQGEVVSRGKWDLFGKLVSWIRKDTLLSAHTVRAFDETKIQKVLSALQGEGQDEKIRTFSHLLIESAQTAESNPTDSSPLSQMSETAQNIHSIIQQSSLTPANVRQNVESYVQESSRKAAAMESLRKDVSRLNEVKKQISTLLHQLNGTETPPQVLTDLKLLRTEKNLLEEKLNKISPELQETRMQLELQAIVTDGMKKNISQMQRINDPTVTAAMPTGDYFRFLQSLTVEVNQEQADGTLEPVVHSPSSFPELEKKAATLNDQADTLEKESKAEDLPTEKRDQLTQHVKMLRDQARSLYQQAAPLKQEHAFATLNSLAETPEEQAVMRELIKTIKEKIGEGRSFNAALDTALEQNVSTLPRNLKYVLIAGAQSSTSFVLESCYSMIPKKNSLLGREGGTLQGGDYGDRNVTIRMRKRPNGSISKITISQQISMGAGTVAGDLTQIPVVSAPVLQETTITVQPDGRRAVQNSVSLAAVPTIVGEDPAHQLIASRLTETYRDAQTTGYI